jgi:hypothetical protein
MLINSLEKMESIISSSSNLEWDGWDVVKYTPSSNSMFAKDGVYKNGEWQKKKVFPLTSDGWHIPSSIGKINAGMER